MDIIITILDDKEFLSGFLRECPVPLDEKGEPLYASNEWLTQWGKEQYYGVYERGKTLIARENIEPELDKDIVQ